MNRMESDKLGGNLPQLQNLIKRDPDAYEADFDLQYINFLGHKEIFEQTPSSKDNDFSDLINFVAHVAHCYPKHEDLSKFPNHLIEMLRLHAPVMNHDIRMKIVEALILLRNRNMLSPILLIEIAFDLLHCQDKLLRKVLQEHIFQDIKNINAKSKNMVINRDLQNFMARKLADSQAVAVKTSLDVMIKLFKKRIWNDKKTANIIVTSCYSKSCKIMVTGLKFFLGNDEGEDENEDSSDDENEPTPSVKKAILANRVNKKTSKRKNQLEKMKRAANDTDKKRNKKEYFDFSALHLINDPQTVAENILKLFNKRNERFEVKLLMMNMISRLIGVHELYLPNFYPTLQKYLFHTQKEVTKIMTYAAQAAHQSVPPDEIYPILRTLANNFVTERHSNEVMAMGLNAIREICNRNHYAMDEDLLQDLVEYRNHKDKGVYMAARSIMTLFRQINPQMLARKTRGMPTELLKENKAEKFGENTAKSFIPGAEILAFQTRNEDFTEDVEDSSDEEDVNSEGNVETEMDIPDDIEDSMEDGEEIESDENDDEVDENDNEVDENDDEVDENDDDEDEDENDDDEDENDDDEDENDDDDEVENDENDVEEVENDSEYEDIEEDITKQNVDDVKHPPILNKKEAIKEVLKLTPEERAAKATDIVSTRFLTDEDFAKINKVQAAKSVERFKNKKGKKRKAEEMSGVNDREIVPLSSIEMVYKKRRHDKEARMQATLAVRAQREKFGSTKGRSNPFASTTNKEKNKTKSFSMTKHKKRLGKMKRSFRDKQAKLKQSMLRNLKNG